MFNAIEVVGTVGDRLALVHAKDEEVKSFDGIRVRRVAGRPHDRDDAHRRHMISASWTPSRSEAADRGADASGVIWIRARLVVSGKN
jgi:hypothetical protein